MALHSTGSASTTTFYVLLSTGCAAAATCTDLTCFPPLLASFTSRSPILWPDRAVPRHPARCPNPLLTHSFRLSGADSSVSIDPIASVLSPEQLTELLSRGEERCWLLCEVCVRDRGPLCMDERASRISADYMLAR